MVERFARAKPKAPVLLNVNVPDVPQDMIAGIEIYSGPATTPTAFGAGHCGVVAIWTTGARGG